MEYKIYLDGESVGTAVVERQGLFYYIACFCNLPIGNRYDIKIATASDVINLGLYVPNYHIKSRIPVKKIGESGFQFQVVRRAETERIYPAFEGKQFPYISKLPQASLRQNDSGTYILITETKV